MTATLLFRDDAYLKDCKATVTAINDKGGILLDRTVFYATAGGQPGDRGTLSWDGGEVTIATTVYDEAKDVVHVPAEGQSLPAVGTQVTLTLDWDNRYRNMRAHTLMHLLCASVPFPVTGGAIGEDGGRIDFDIPEGQIPDKTELTATLNRLVSEDHPVTFRWITDEEMAATMDQIQILNSQLKSMMSANDGRRNNSELDDDQDDQDINRNTTQARLKQMDERA